jgi:hypothetical protein
LYREVEPFLTDGEEECSNMYLLLFASGSLTHGDLVWEDIVEPIVVKGKEYSNFMEEVSRRVSQAF